MQAKMERIGGGMGLLLPKELVDACGFGQEASVTVRGKTLVVEDAQRCTSKRWEEAVMKIPQEAIDRDFEELRDFREMPRGWGEAAERLGASDARPDANG